MPSFHVQYVCDDVQCAHISTTLAAALQHMNNAHGLKETPSDVDIEHQSNAHKQHRSDLKHEPSVSTNETSPLADEEDVAELVEILTTTPVEECALEYQIACAKVHVCSRCVICNDIAAEQSQFGARVCQNCDSFFARHDHLAPAVQTCTRGDNKCRFTPYTRRVCPACRFRQCIEAGMKKVSRTASTLKSKTSERTAETQVSQIVENIRRASASNDDKPICVVCDNEEHIRRQYGTVVCAGCGYELLKFTRRYHCFSCSSFFFRATHNGGTWLGECINVQSPGACTVTKKTRSDCKRCTYEKCLQQGLRTMSRTNDNTTNEQIDAKRRRISNNANDNSEGSPKQPLFTGDACAICGASPEGMRFGAMTCRACREFYQMHYSEEAPRCKRSNRCRITEKTRRCCQACRLRRCKEAGIKTPYMDLRTCAKSSKSTSITPSSESQCHSPSGVVAPTKKNIDSTDANKSSDTSISAD